MSGSTEAPAGGSATTPSPLAMLRSRSYLRLLLTAAVLGVPVSAPAYGFLAVVDELQELTYTELPRALGFDGTPPWWPLPLLGVSGLLVGLTIERLPGRGGHDPVDGPRRCSSERWAASPSRT